MKGAQAETLCIGAAHWDIIGRADRRLVRGDDVPGRIIRRAGGVAMNVALGLAALGCPVGLCAAVGDDAAGDALMRQAVDAGIDCSHLLRIAGAATDAYVAIEDNSGDLVGAVADAGLAEDHAGTIADRAGAAIAGARTVFVEANIPASALQSIVASAHAAGAEIIANPVSPARAERLSDLLAEEHNLTIVANVAEANVLSGQCHADAESAARALVDLGAGTGFVTDGPRSAALATRHAVFTCKPARLVPGASVTGAGDALLAAFLASPDRHRDPLAAMEFSLQAAARKMTRTE